MSAERFVRAVGWTSVALAAVGAVAPRRLASAGGVRDVTPGAVPVLVRMISARQAALGLAILTRKPVPVGRSARLFLPVTALDLAAVAAGARSGALRPASAVASAVVLATDLLVAGRARGA